MTNKHRTLKSSVSEQELDKIIDADSAWLRQHEFTNSIMPARVEIYRYKA